jgi:hypothetical protein
MIATWYDNNTGKINGFTDSIAETLQYKKDNPWEFRSGCSLIDGFWEKGEYYINLDFAVPAPTPRVEPYCTLSGQTISNIHNPSRLICTELGVDEEITEGEVVLNIDTPGIYQFTVRSVPFLDKTFEVIV